MRRFWSQSALRTAHATTSSAFFADGCKLIYAYVQTVETGVFDVRSGKGNRAPFAPPDAGSPDCTRVSAGSIKRRRLPACNIPC